MQDQPQPGWTFNPGQSPSQTPKQPAGDPSAIQQPQPGDDVSWTASEFVEHDKTFSWYAAFILAAVVGIAAIYLVTRDLFSVIALSLFAIAFMVFAARKPKVLSYNLSDQGIHVGEKFYAFGQFKSFSVVDEGALRSITLLPLRRFMPALNVYFAPEDESKIANFLGARLPHEERRQDPVDKFMHRIRF